MFGREEYDEGKKGLMFESILKMAETVRGMTLHDVV